METNKFISLIQNITGRNLQIDTQDEILQFEKEYYVFIVLPITDRKIYFKWVTPKTTDKFLRSFITSFTTKFFQPNPSNYNGRYGSKWEDMDEKQREYAYHHHRSNMYSKNELLEQIHGNFNSDNICNTLIKYGFYSTEYGIGIFALWATDGVLNAIQKLKQYLQSKNIPYTNEYSDARWVYRYKLGLDKNTHTSILNNFSN
mgnify:CR=1 FL=1